MSLAAFLAFLCISKSWPTELTLQGDVVALRFLLFLSHVYGAALLLTCPLVTLEALSRLRQAQAAPSHADGPGSGAQEAAEEAEDGGAGPHKGQQQCYGVSFLCCLSVWVITALHVRWRWTLEDVWTAACLHTSSSLLTCLPSLFSPVSSSTSSCIAFTFFLLLLLLLTVDLRARCRASAQLAEARKPNQGLVSGLIPACAGLPQTLVSVHVCCFDPEKTGSSCVVPKKSVQVSAAAIMSPERFPAGQKQERTKGAKARTLMAQEERNRCVWCQWGFPCLGLNVIIGLMGVLCIFVLPLILSVNIVLVQTVDYLMELSVKALLVSNAADKRSTAVSRKATGSRSTCQHWFQKSSFSQARNNLEI